MPIEKTFRQLGEQLRMLRDQLLGLQLTIREDLPAQGGVMLIDKFGDAVDDTLGWLEESLAAAIEAERALVSPPKLELARKQLSSAQTLFHRVQRGFQTELVSYERLKDLTAFGRSRRGEWAVWVKTVKDGLDQCQGPVEQVNNSLLECWQEISERGAVNSVYVHSTNIGQQIATAETPEAMGRAIP